jgi:hypothetical protein
LPPKHHLRNSFLMFSSDLFENWIVKQFSIRLSKRTICDDFYAVILTEIN